MTYKSYSADDIEYKYCPPPSDEIQGSKIGKVFVRLFRFVGYNPMKRRCTIFPFNKIEFFIFRLWFSGLTEVVSHEEYLAK